MDRRKDSVTHVSVYKMSSGFIPVREMSGNFFFQGQGILCCVSEKCRGNVREFYNFQFVSNDEKQKTARAVFLTFYSSGLVFSTHHFAKC